MTPLSIEELLILASMTLSLWDHCAKACKLHINNACSCYTDQCLLLSRSSVTVSAQGNHTWLYIVTVFAGHNLPANTKEEIAWTEHCGCAGSVWQYKMAMIIWGRLILFLLFVCLFLFCFVLRLTCYLCNADCPFLALDL
jgi:hypothetical protein